jgi:DNA polymerase III subunit epsilon
VEIILLLILAAGIAAYFYSKRRRPVSLGHLPERFVVFDLETTGLTAGTNEIIEIGAIRVNRDSTQHETYQTLVKPTRKVPKKITELTGITQEMINADAQALDSALREFAEFVGDLRLVTFNAEFDMAFLNAATSKAGVASFRNPISCALKMSRRAWPGRKSYRLAELSKDGNLSAEGTHRALGDCQRALIVYTAAASKLRAVS